MSFALSPHTVNIHLAKTTLSKLVEAVASGRNPEGVVIARNGKPAARLVPLANPVAPVQRIGIAKGKFPPVNDNVAKNQTIANLFLESP
jgi:prevent-host-death family protein